MSIDLISKEIGLDERPRRQETILVGADAQTRFKTASKRSSDPPLSIGGHTPGSDEGRPNLLKLMNICTKLSNRVLALEDAKTIQDKVITRLKLRVRRLEKKRKYMRASMDGTESGYRRTWTR
nr:hypothetical protein [Tanacetum cinerariifolium]